ncbi:MAG: hypothetical protein PWP27_1366 [Clostridiales bacterium]|nr:hypothetical protein [Clostridiales bacterium]MDK2933556.1 hypothetical protein [Clostridiales bacterium]
MFCYSVVTNIQCVLRELDMWSEISKEHPIFIKTVAKLTNKNLAKEITDRLDKVNENFSNLQKHVKTLSERLGYGGTGWMNYTLMSQVSRLIEMFLKYDVDFLNVLKQVKTYGKDDKVWQTLIEHITEEEEYMYRLFTTLRSQLYMGY